MKELLCSYAAYDTWANQKLLDIVLSLSEEQHQQKLASSFNSLHATFLHVWDAQTAWWYRVSGTMGEFVRPSSTNPSMHEVAEGLQRQSRLWNAWMNEAEINELQKMLTYQNFKQEEFTQPLWQILLHLFNHSTYHRGQVVTMLRQLGVSNNIPSTDYITFTRQ